MRSLVLAAFAFALVACGQSSQPASVQEEQLPAWRVALTESPRLVIAYSTTFGPLAGSQMVQDGTTTRVTTTPVNGGWAGMIPLGDIARNEPGAALRITATVSSGALHFLTIYDGRPDDYQPAQATISAGGETTVYVPVDAAGPPVLVVANGNGEGASEGVVTAIELVAPPAAPATP